MRNCDVESSGTLHDDTESTVALLETHRTSIRIAVVVLGVTLLVYVVWVYFRYYKGGKSPSDTDTGGWWW